MLSPSTETETSTLSVVSGSNKYDDEEIARSVQILYTYVGTAHSGAYRAGMVKQPQDTEFVQSDPEWVYVFFRYVAKMLADKKLTGHPFEVVDGGLEGVGEGLKMLKAGKAKGFKYIFKVATPSSN
jgi:NADPH2:quinone reductase